MGRLIDITQFDGMSKEERKAKAEELDRTGGEPSSSSSRRGRAR